MRCNARVATGPAIISPSKIVPVQSCHIFEVIGDNMKVPLAVSVGNVARQLVLDKLP
jgi:hypothetical protein